MKMIQQRLTGLVTALFLPLWICPPLWALDSALQQQPSIEESLPRLTLTASDKDSFWSSPWVPTGMSFLAPGSGQLYSSNLFGEAKDWFALVRGVAYMGITGVSYWQLSNANNNTQATNILWVGILIATSVISPIDAYLTTALKEQSLLTPPLDSKALFEEAIHTAQAGDYAKAIELLEKIPPEASEYQNAQVKIQSFKQILLDQKATATFEQAYALAKQGEFTQAILLLKTIPKQSNVFEKAQTKLKEWQYIIDEREAKALYEEGKTFAQQGDYAKAVETLKRIKSTTSYYKNAQMLINQWSYQK